MQNPVVLDLFALGSVDTTGVFTGPLRRIDLVEVAAGAAAPLGRDDAEVAVFVHSGAGRLARTDAGHPATDLVAETCVLIPAGARARVSADTDLRLTAVSLVLEPAPEPADLPGASR